MGEITLSLLPGRLIIVSVFWDHWQELVQCIISLLCGKLGKNNVGNKKNGVLGHLCAHIG